MSKTVMERVTDLMEANTNPNHEDLEAWADMLLEDTLKDRSRTKAKTEEYPVLSGRQFQRRQRKEIPFSALPKGVKVAFGFSTAEDQEG